MSEMISVIVPVFNACKYLPKCIESIMGQTYDALDIILVDDGSTDGSSDICDAYAKKDNRIQVYHQDNKGVSCARNKGLELARGEYIGFVDSDDYIDLDMYEVLLREMKEKDADMVICGYQLTELNVEGPVEISPVQDEVLDVYAALQKLNIDRRWYYVTLFNRLYKRAVFENISFPNGKIHEDYAIAPNLFMNCSRIATIEKCPYHYQRSENSIMTSKITVKRLDGVEASYDRFRLYEKLGYEELLPGTFVSAVSNFQVLRSLVCRTKEEKKRKSEVKKMFQYMYQRTKGNKNVKHFFLAYFPELYFALRRTYKALRKREEAS